MGQVGFPLGDSTVRGALEEVRRPVGHLSLELHGVVGELSMVVLHRLVAGTIAIARWIQNKESRGVSEGQFDQASSVRVAVCVGECERLTVVVYLIAELHRFDGVVREADDSLYGPHVLHCPRRVVRSPEVETDDQRQVGCARTRSQGRDVRVGDVVRELKAGQVGRRQPMRVVPSHGPRWKSQGTHGGAMEEWGREARCVRINQE